MSYGGKYFSKHQRVVYHKGMGKIKRMVFVFETHS